MYTVDLHDRRFLATLFALFALAGTPCLHYSHYATHYIYTMGISKIINALLLLRKISALLDKISAFPNKSEPFLRNSR